MTNITDTEVLDRIAERGEDDDMWDTEVPVASLAPVLNFKDPRMKIAEGATAKQADYRAINFVSLGVEDPRWLFEVFREEAPNNADDIIDRGMETQGGPPIRAPSPSFKSDRIGHTRPMGYVRAISKMAGELDDWRGKEVRQDNYTYRLFNRLARTTTKLNLATNPFNQTKEVYIHERGPVRIVPGAEKKEDETEEEPEANSAADVTW